MEHVDDLLAIERGFWRAAGDCDRYAEHLAADAVHVLPGLGALTRDAVLAGVAAADPWQTFEIAEPTVVPVGDDAAAVVYRARAQRAGGSPYTAAITSVYRRADGSWELVLHQQTPLADHR